MIAMPEFTGVLVTTHLPFAVHVLRVNGRSFRGLPLLLPHNAGKLD